MIRTFKKYQNTEEYNQFIMYTTNTPILINGKKVIICRYHKKYPWKYVVRAIYKLGKELNIKNQRDVKFEGNDEVNWETTKFPKFEFNGEKFIQI